MLSPKAKKQVVYGFLLAVALLLAVGLSLAYYAISVSLQAERTFHAVNLVTKVMQEYVKREGRWPVSWDELRTVASVEHWAMYSWPDDLENVSHLVTVEFNVDLAAIARQPIDGFHAVEPMGPCYPRDHGRIAELIETAKEEANGQHADGR